MAARDHPPTFPPSHTLTSPPQNLGHVCVSTPTGVGAATTRKYVPQLRGKIKHPKSQIQFPHPLRALCGLRVSNSSLALPQTTKNYISPTTYRTEQVQILTNLLQRSTRTDCGLCPIISHRWPCSAHSISRGGAAVPNVLIHWPTIHQQHPRRILG